MNRDHATFEALAGAVALGEANAAERAAFATHAAECGECAAQARETSPLELLRQARDSETWRPQVDGALFARVRETRSSNVRRTFGVLAYAAALSIVLNVAVATGFADRLYARFEDSGRPVAAPAAAPPPARIASGPPATSVRRVPHAYIPRLLTVPPLAKDVRRGARDPGGRLGEVPDVLAGLVQPSSVTASRDVAAEAFSLEASPADRSH